jgi:hypothetical protein
VGAYDTSIDDLRARVQKVAEQVSRQLARTPAGEQFFLVNDVVTAIENAVGDVVNVAQDAVNTVVNATHDAVTAIEFVGERIVHVLDNFVDDATIHTDFIVAVTPTVTVFDGIEETLIAGPPISSSAALYEALLAHRNKSEGSKASISTLIQARRTAILRERKAFMSAVADKRTEIRARIGFVREKVAFSRRLK